MSNEITHNPAKLRKVSTILQDAQNREESNHVEDFQIHLHGYAEPGYENPESGIIVTGNFNDDQSDLPSRLAKIFEERYDVELEWSDEWVACDHCRKLFRVSPDSYGWRQYGAFIGDECVCGDCIKQDPEDYLKSIEGGPRTAISIAGLDPVQHGYVLLKGECERGLHGGQDADPRVAARSLRDLGCYRFLFAIEHCEQFSLTFSIYLHESEHEHYLAQQERLGEPGLNVRGNDPAENLKKGLQTATAEAAKVPPGDGPIISTINSDTGEVITRRVSREQFINGIKD